MRAESLGRNVAAVLFDLDGTLLDTAPDLIFALNTALSESGYPACPEEAVKPHISGGGRAMLRFALEWPELHRDGQPLGEGADLEALIDRLLSQLLEVYQAHIADRTEFFDGMARVLDALDTRRMPWGIVTNKTRRFSEPLMEALNLQDRAHCVVSGDSTAERKPHPLPLLEASRRLDLAPERCVYVGDAAKDMEAGRRAGMTTLAALYGYIGADDDPGSWGADGSLARPLDLLSWLDGRGP